MGFLVQPLDHDSACQRVTRRHDEFAEIGGLVGRHDVVGDHLRMLLVLQKQRRAADSDTGEEEATLTIGAGAWKRQQSVALQNPARDLGGAGESLGPEADRFRDTALAGLVGVVELASAVGVVNGAHPDVVNRLALLVHHHAGQRATLGHADLVQVQRATGERKVGQFLYVQGSLAVLDNQEQRAVGGHATQDKATELVGLGVGRQQHRSPALPLLGGQDRVQPDVGQRDRHALEGCPGLALPDQLADQRATRGPGAGPAALQGWVDVKARISHQALHPAAHLHLFPDHRWLLGLWVGVDALRLFGGRRSPGLRVGGPGLLHQVGGRQRQGEDDAKQDERWPVDHVGSWRPDYSTIARAAGSGSPPIR